MFFRSDGERMSVDTASAQACQRPLCPARRSSFLRLAGPQPEAAIRGGSVHIEGDAEVAQAFSELLKQARPDLEEELSRVIGDVAAHQVGNVARAALGFGQRAADTFTQNVAEFLQEESRDVPTRTEADEFIAAVDNYATTSRGSRRDCARRNRARGEAAMERIVRGCRRATSDPITTRCAASPACWKSSACSCGTGSTTSFSRRICSGRCASRSISRRQLGFNASAPARARERLRLAFEELGPIFMKFGQMLSTRRDSAAARHRR